MSWVTRHIRSGPPLTVGEALRLARKNHGFRQLDLAAAMGVPVSRVSRVETGRANPTDDYLAACFASLGLDRDERSSILAAAGVDSVQGSESRPATHEIAPLALRVSEYRHQAIAELTRVRQNLADVEAYGIEAGLIEEVTIPALDRAIAALGLDPAITQEWLEMRGALAEGKWLIEAARRAFERARDVAAVTQIVQFLGAAEQVFRALGL